MWKNPAGNDQNYNTNEGEFIYDVRCILGIFDLPTYPHQILYYIQNSKINGEDFINFVAFLENMKFAT